MSSLKFEQMDLTSYNEVKDADYIPGDSIDTGYNSLETASSLLSSGKRSLLLQDVSTACSSLAEACTIYSEELEEGSEQGAEAAHWYGKALLEWISMEGGVFEYAMEGFNLGEAEEPKVDVEEGELSREEQAEIEDKVARALEENYDLHDNVAKIHMDVDMESEEESEESEDDSEDSEADEDDSVVEDEAVEEELAEPSNLEVAWEVLEVARLGYTKAGNKAALSEVYLDLGEASLENQDYGRAELDFAACLDIKKSLLPADSRSVASSHYQLGLAQAYSGKMTEAEANFQSAIRILEARSNHISKLENSDIVTMEKIDLETCIQEIKEIIVDQKDMHKQIATGTVGAKLTTRMGMKPETMMSAKRSATVKKRFSLLPSQPRTNSLYGTPIDADDRAAERQHKLQPKSLRNLLSGDGMEEEEEEDMAALKKEIGEEVAEHKTMEAEGLHYGPGGKLVKSSVAVGGLSLAAGPITGGSA